MKHVLEKCMHLRVLWLDENFGFFKSFYSGRVNVTVIAIKDIKTNNRHGGIAVSYMWHIFLPAICGGKLISPIFDFMLSDSFCDIVKKFTVSYLMMLLSIFVSTGETFA